MQKLNFSEKLGEILKKDKRYDGDAYYFVREGLDFTLRMLKKGAQGASRHVSGQELLEGLRRYALDQFGPMGKTVLGHWGVGRCEDFGEIVFSMVDKGILGRTEQDTRADFKGGYDFDAAFVKPFEPVARPNGSRSRANAPARNETLHVNRRSSSTEKLNSGSN